MVTGIMRDGTATRERIERTAMTLIVARGVAETTIRHIADGAGIAEGALYRHYRGKDEMVAHLFTRHYTDFAHRLDLAQAEAAGTRAKLAAMIAECGRLYDADPVLFRFLLLVQHHSIHHLEDGVETPVEVVRAALARGMAAGEIPARDPDLVTALVMGMIIQTATFMTYGRIIEPMTSLVPALADACWRVLQD